METLEMTPPPGERQLRFVGDTVEFTLRSSGAARIRQPCRAFLRTNLGRARRVREEIIQSYTRKLPSASSAWRDVPMRERDGGWHVELPLVEVGYFQAKAYLIDATGRQFWPPGPDAGVTVHPDQYRTANTIYCAFVRMFGESKTASVTTAEALDNQLARLDKLGYAVIPPSGKLRDLIAELPHITETLGCRILHLLPVNPTPTTYARFGRYGSPYAAQDLLAVDPALVEFDRRTTAIDQFRELTYAAHLRGARVFLDIVTNHTGWGSTLQNEHPEWFLRHANGVFASPGAWGVTWEDLVELDHRNPASWEHLAEVFLTWCRRGVDGFRCDAGYKVPMAAWRYITACVRQEYPETVFLLEGLGGSWEATESLLADGGMQWAYSELFQNYSGAEVSRYLDYALAQSARVGLYVHYSETHDNERLARQGRAWSLLRNGLCALTSVSGGFGFTCGVEWLAPERVNVHSSRGLRWGSNDNLNTELGQLNRLLAEHPCFFDGAKLTRLSPADSPVLALRRDSAEGLDRVLVLVNTDPRHPQSVLLEQRDFEALGRSSIDLITGNPFAVQAAETGSVLLTLAPAAFHCLSPSPVPQGLSGAEYRRARARASFAVQALRHAAAVEDMGALDWRKLAELADRDPRALLAGISALADISAHWGVIEQLEHRASQPGFPRVIVWETVDARRTTLVPPDHWLLIRDDFPFRASLESDALMKHTHSVLVRDGHVAFFEPRRNGCDARLFLERYAPDGKHLEASLRFLSGSPRLDALMVTWLSLAKSRPAEAPMLLLTNGRGGMARLCSDLGRIRSKYDCLLGANLHPSVPVDRHVFVKRCRAWINADRFISPLDCYNTTHCEPGPPAHWRFVANAGDGRTVEVHLHADMLQDRNTTVLRFERPALASASDTELPPSCEVRLTLRFDLEDRNFHWETRRNPGAEHHFSVHSRPLQGRAGFEFTPADDRMLRVYAERGEYHHQEEWSENIPHPIEQTRGQADRGDAFSPGWFDLPLRQGESVAVVVCADPSDPAPAEVENFQARRRSLNAQQIALASITGNDVFAARLAVAAHQFLVRRNDGKTVVAGYPWFLDWGRDTLICARGLIAAGLRDDVDQILRVFGRFELNGTLPNSIHGEDASNRDTSDAPLWFGVVCEDMALAHGHSVYDQFVDGRRTLRQVLASIADGYTRGTPNGIIVDPDTALVWSPSHFTWMDTNYPAATPRAGFPVEIQVLWIRLLQQLARIDAANRERWTTLADHAQRSFFRLFWLQEQGWLADCLLAGPGQSAAAATPDTALRSNFLFAIALGVLTGEPARRGVTAAQKYLVVPGALRSLAPLPVTPPLPIYGTHGQLLNNPNEPYWGQYQGDEDTRRKPAYHNGTAWTWTFPTFCEALVRAWDRHPHAISAAKAYLASMDTLLMEGCLGQMPEVLDGDAPHAHRGCDAQAWAATEALRVWKWLAAGCPTAG